MKTSRLRAISLAALGAAVAAAAVVPASATPADDMLAAVAGENFPALRAALKKGANVNMKNSDGDTPLISAAAVNPDARLVSELIRLGADVNAKDSDGDTALMEAGHADIASTLIKAGADINSVSNEGWTPLIWAVGKGNTDVASALIKAGAKLDLKNKDGDTALSLAKKYQHPDIAALLEKAGASAGRRHASLAKQESQIINRAARIVPDHNLFTAIGRGDLAGIRSALKQGARVNDDSVLEMAVDHNPDYGPPGPANLPAIVAALIKAGADVNAKNTEGTSVLMMAAYSGEPKVVAQLIKAGADVNARGPSGTTALISAAGRGLPATVRLLLKAGADPRAKDKNGKTAIFYVNRFLGTAEIKALLRSAR